MKCLMRIVCHFKGHIWGAPETWKSTDRRGQERVFTRLLCTRCGRGPRE